MNESRVTLKIRTLDQIANITLLIAIKTFHYYIAEDRTHLHSISESINIVCTTALKGFFAMFVTTELSTLALVNSIQILLT